MTSAKLSLDCALTNQRRYGRKALPSHLVQHTWQGTLYDELNLPDKLAQHIWGFSGYRGGAPFGTQPLALADGPSLSPTLLTASGQSPDGPCRYHI
jgi:hypothetical protein